MRITKWGNQVNDLIVLIRLFMDETIYPLTYSDNNTLDFLYSLLKNPDVGIFINYQDGKPAGFISVYRATECQAEYTGEVHKFYVAPYARGTRCARELMQEAIDWFDTFDCVLSFCDFAAGVGQDKLFKNLIAKFGYVPTGTSFMRNKHG